MKLSAVFGASSFTCAAMLIGAQYHVHESHPACEQASEWSFWLLLIGFLVTVGWVFARLEKV